MALFGGVSIIFCPDSVIVPPASSAWVHLLVSKELSLKLSEILSGKTLSLQICTSYSTASPFPSVPVKFTVGVVLEVEEESAGLFKATVGSVFGPKSNSSNDCIYYSEKIWNCSAPKALSVVVSFAPPYFNPVEATAV